MTPISFTKMSGSGNDFIIIDNRKGVVPSEISSRFAKHVCRRKLSVGADGLILVEPSESCDFKWHFLNSDGSVAEMCGNGARCVARFALTHKIAREQMTFETIAGIIQAQVSGDRVKIGMTEPFDLVRDATLGSPPGMTYCSINTGVPHVVIAVDDIESVDVVGIGRQIRHHSAFGAAGTNVNFVGVGPQEIGMVRTYERGVEDETLACGTGIVAAALIQAEKEGVLSPVTLRTKSGRLLKVYFSKAADGYKSVFLEGEAQTIYEGRMMPDAWCGT